MLGRAAPDLGGAAPELGRATAMLPTVSTATRMGIASHHIRRIGTV